MVTQSGSKPHNITIGILISPHSTVKVLRHGHELILHEGDAVFLYDSVISSNTPETIILLNNGKEFTFSNDERVLFDEPTLITGHSEHIDPEHWDIQDKLLDEHIKMDEQSHITIQQKRHYDDPGLTLFGSLDMNQGQAGVFATQYGYLTMTGADSSGTGNYLYRLDPANSNTQNLPSGSTIVDHLQGSVAPGIIFMMTPHAPVITGTINGTVIEDQQLQSSGQLHITDINPGEAHFQAVIVHGRHGDLSIDATGHWIYSLDNTAAQSLAAGQTALDKIEVTTADGTKQLISMVITGTNDVPTLGLQQTNGSTGTLSATDTDLTDTEIFSVINGVGQFGTLTVDPITGDYSYHQNASVAGMNFDPKTGVYSAQDVFEVHVSDGHGGEVSQFVTFNAAATVAASVLPGGTPVILPQITTQPVLSPTHPGNAVITTPVNGVTIDLDAKSDSGSSNTDNFTNDQSPTVSGHTDIPFSTIEIYDGTTKIGAITSDGSGHYSVTTSVLTDSVHNISAQATAPSATLPVNSASLAVTVDTAINAADDTATTDEDAKTAISGNVITNDDHANGETVNATSALKTAHGIYTLNTDGSYTFTVDTAASQHLAIGDKATDTLTYEITDKAGNTTSAILTTTITGTNDKPIIAAPPLIVATEDGNTVTGQILSHDVDNKDTATFTTTNAPAGFTLHADGSYSFDPGNQAYQSLVQNQHHRLDIPITVTDSAGASSSTVLAIELTGTGDAAVITGIDTGSAKEDVKVSMAQGEIGTGGQLNITDSDAGEAKFDTKFNQGGYSSALGGHLILTPDGSWSYVINNSKPNIQALAEGETLTDTVSVKSVDGTTHDIVVTITGTNDAPTVSGPVVLPTGTEDKSFTVTAAELMSHVTDIDTSDVLRIGSNIVSLHAIINGPVNGVYTVIPDANYNGPLSLMYSVVDDEGGVIRATATTVIAATPDGAVITSTTVDVTEDTHTTATIQLGITDADAGQAHFQTTPLTGAHGSATITADGQLSYTLDNGAAQHLKEGESITDIIVVTSVDGTKHDVSININGTNDNPVINTVATQRGTEDGRAVFGRLTATDIDTGDTVTFTTSSTQAGFSLNAQGIYALDPTEPAFQHLAAGESMTVHVDVQAVDSFNGTSQAQTLSFIITGTNDTPSVSAPVVLPGINEDTRAIITQAELLAHASDVDATDILKVANVSANHGYAFMDSSGNVNYIPDPNFNGKVTFSYEVTDNHGGMTHTTATLDVAPVNDAPELSVNQTSNTSGTLTAIDVDTTDTHTFSAVNGVGHYGILTVDPITGAYNYAQNNSVTGMNYDPKTGKFTGQEAFEIKVSDNHGGLESKFITFNSEATLTAQTQTTPDGQIVAIPNVPPVVSVSVPNQPVISTTQPAVTPQNTGAANDVQISLAYNSDTGSSSSDKVTKDATPEITGWTDIPFSKVEIMDGSKVIATAVSDAHGVFYISTSALSDGIHTLTANATPPGSTAHVSSSRLDIIVDTSVEQLSVELYSNSGDATDNITNDGGLKIGHHEAGATVEYSVDGGNSWAKSFTPQNGSNTVEVRQTDMAGNVSTPTSLTFTLDNSATAPIVELLHDTGPDHTHNQQLLNDKITQNAQLHVTHEVGATVEYSVDGGQTWSANFNPANDGQIGVDVRQTDVSGNQSPVTHFDFTYDTTKPVFAINNTPDSNNPSYTISGTVDGSVADMLVAIVKDGEHVDTQSFHIVPDPQGNWHVTTATLADAGYKVEVTGTDLAGNTVLLSHSNYSSHFNIDTSANAAATAVVTGVAHDEPEQTQQVDELQFDLSHASNLLEDSRSGKFIADTREAMEKVAGLLDEESDSVEQKLIHQVENAPVKASVPSEHAIQKAEAGSSSDEAAHGNTIKDADYAPPSHPLDDDDEHHHDGSGLT